LSHSAAVVRVSPEEAAQHLVKKVDPVYPALAQTFRIQDTVVLNVVIKSDGSVASAKQVSGDAMFGTAAIQAVKKWQYHPFLVDGKAAKVTTTVSVPFSLGISDADYKKEKETAQLYYKQDKDCRSAISNRHYSDAQRICGEEVKTAEQLPAGREMERVEAYALLGLEHCRARDLPALHKCQCGTENYPKSKRSRTRFL
jgi:TonB family protein